MTDKPLVSLSDVRKTYRLGETEVQALRGVNLRLQPGEFTAIVGASGSGKSTLLNIIGCIDAPDSGTVEFEGRSTLGLSEDEKSRLRNRSMGFVFQSFNLVPVLTVAENIELPLLLQKELSTTQRAERVLSALTDVGLQDYAKQWPDKLSGGQRQRVAIARALVTSPKLVIADEPTANLDSATAHRIVDLLAELNAHRNVTFLFSTHDEKLMGRVKRIIRIQDGAFET
jgi:putative ABC transport system ATP-binding protein